MNSAIAAMISIIRGPMTASGQKLTSGV